MANNDYAIRFSENKYASKLEVSKELNLSLVDPLWSNILAYRSTFYEYLPIISVDRNQIFICLNSFTIHQGEELDKRLYLFNDEVNKLSSVNGDNRYFAFSCHLEILKHINSFRNYQFLEKELKEILVAKEVPLGVNNSHLYYYLSALKFINEHYEEDFSENYIANLYGALTGQDELTYFYRLNDENSKANYVQVARVYSSAPSNLIETMMSKYFELMNSNKIDSSFKALISYYYIDYIKPFASFNEEMAVLIAKSLLAHYFIKEKATLIPFEKILLDRLDSGLKYFNEVQKTCDITYFIHYFISYLNKMMNESTGLIKSLSSYNKIEEPINLNEEKKEKALVDSKNNPNIKTVKIEDKKINYQHISLFDEESNDASNNIEPKKEEKQENLGTSGVKPEIAVSYIPEELDDKTAKRLARHLLETDPELKKGEAKFYSKHCTLGKIYTIQQYKKEIGCVYETARTSMDHLRKLGYYQESMVKNKKVYTPLKRK